MNGLYWMQPWWLLAALYPLLFLVLLGLRRQAMKRRIADPELWPWVWPAQDHKSASNKTSNSNSAIQRWTLGLAWILICIAAAGPRLPLSVPKHAQAEPGSLMFVLDHSQSMAARDQGMSRYQAALRQITAWLGADPGHERPPHFGLVLVAGKAHLHFPPSADPDTTAFLLKQAREVVLPTLGNDLAAGLTLALKQLQHRKGHKALVLLTDGDVGETSQTAVEQVLQTSTQTPIDLHIIAMGTTQSTPVPSAQGGWMLQDGRPVISRRQSAWLHDLADKTGASLHDGTDLISLDSVWRTASTRISDEQAQGVIWQELYPWALIPGLLLLVSAMFGVRLRLAPHVFAPVMCALLFMSNPESGHADDRGRELLKADTEKALAYYRLLPGHEGRFGEGVACFRLHDFACAQQAFATAAWLAPDDHHRGRAVFNLGITYYQQGDYRSAAELFRDAQAHGLDRPSLPQVTDFTQELADQIDLRLKQEAASRALRMARAGRTAEQTPSSASDNQALDQQASAPGPLPAGLFPADINPEQYQALLELGLTRAKQEQKNASNNAHSRDQHIGESVPLERPSHELWQRLFELEEGFPAPLEHPRARPGVRPW